MSTVLGKSKDSNQTRADPIPNIRAAGHQIPGVNGESADYSIRQDVHMYANDGMPGTPEHLKKFRKTHVNQPGIIQKHHGVANDPMPFPANYSYGKGSHGSEGVQGVIKANNLTGMQDKFNDIKESKYASHAKEPLGHGLDRQYNWPEHTQGGHKFGLPSKGLENAKDMLYPANGMGMENDQVTEMYKKTHGNFGPGEQKNRNYDWQLDPVDHRFGYQEKRVLNGAAAALHSERPEEQFPRTVIVQKVVEDQKAVSSDILGRSKNLGQGQAPRGDDFVHGIKNVQGENPWNAARCIHGEPTATEVAADSDLGRSTKPGCRNTVRRAEDAHRSFGLPTIRNDIPLVTKDKRSVADFQNYGDEPEAVDLLFPSNYSELGITEEDFREPRTREEITSLFRAIGYEYKIGKFNAMYNRAKELGGRSDDRISVRDFQLAVSMLHNVE